MMLNPKRMPSALLALGRRTPPPQIDVGGGSYRFVHLFKHDFFAATAVYEGDTGRVILKLGRQADFLGLPCTWIGRFLARREAAAYRALADLDAVPRFLGHCGETGIVHEFIEGRPLDKDVPVPDDFFERLQRAIDTIHRRGMAYVDLEKRQNVIAGDDGRPYLIDFQISWQWPGRYGGELAPLRWLRARFQEGDRYHLLKLQRRIRPDQLTDAQIRESYAKPRYVRLHRKLTTPLLRLRRAVLARVAPRLAGQERGAISD